MWTISLLKQNGKINFKKNYWYCVLVSLVLGICVGGSAGGSSYSSSQNAASEHDYLSTIDVRIILVVLGIIGVAVVIGLILKAILFNPIQVGCRKFFIMNRFMERADLNNIAFGFKSNWKNIAKTMFLQDIFLVGWTLLFIIPGIIKSYSYRLVPYILAENPDMDSMEAITLSRQMMNGNKMKAFLYDLSFIGWYILSIFTCFVLIVFYVGPYKACSDAELYTAVKETYNPQASFN